MRYANKEIGFYFDLPDGWNEIKNLIPITFCGPNGFQSNEKIVLVLGGILPNYFSIESREKFMAEPTAEIARINLGEETNVIILKKPVDSEISAVRDGIHYTISYSNNNKTQYAIDQLCKTFRFPSSTQAANCIALWSNPNKQAISKVLMAKDVDEAYKIATKEGIPTIDLQKENVGIVTTSSKKKDVTPMSQQKILIEKLDGCNEGSKEAEDILVRLGDDTIDDLLESIAEINGRMNGTIRSSSLYPSAEMARLERRVRVLERIQNPMTLKALFDILADSSIAVESYSQQFDTFDERGDLGIPMLVKVHMESAKSLKNSTIKALIAFGTQVVPIANRYMASSKPPVRKALRKVVSGIENKWWQIWK
ncbi:MAG: hypothetical protein IPO69_22110 [Saprospiraceae bacterium]|nr:hypothetical protein [Saprospiraceae bacterium]